MYMYMYMYITYIGAHIILQINLRKFLRVYIRILKIMNLNSQVVPHHIVETSFNEKLP